MTTSTAQYITCPIWQFILSFSLNLVALSATIYFIIFSLCHVSVTLPLVLAKLHIGSCKFQTICLNNISNCHYRPPIQTRSLQFSYVIRIPNAQNIESRFCLWRHVSHELHLTKRHLHNHFRTILEYALY